MCVCLSQDLISALLPRVLPAVTEGLQDLDDDVRAVAASALIPVVEGLVQLLPEEVRTAVYVMELGWIRSFLHVPLIPDERPFLGRQPEQCTTHFYAACRWVLMQQWGCGRGGGLVLTKLPLWDL